MRKRWWVLIGIAVLLALAFAYTQTWSLYARKSHAPSVGQARTVPVTDVHPVRAKK